MTTVRSPLAATGTTGPEPDESRPRYFDRRLNLNVVTISQGDYYVTDDPAEVLTTVLGSCVSACIRDTVLGCGGMNHFLLPEAGGSSSLNSNTPSVSLRYGSFAMEQLINAILSRGGRRDRLEIKVFGGANVLKGLRGIGHKNASFVEEFLANEGFKIASKDLRGHCPRKIQFYPATGLVRMRALADRTAQTVFETEQRRTIRTRVQPEAGEIELFD